MKYKIDLRDKNGKLYRDTNGIIVTGNDLNFERNVKKEKAIQDICADTAFIYEAIAKEGTDITIEVSHLNEISQTYMVLYSYYHTERKFVKH